MVYIYLLTFLAPLNPALIPANLYWEIHCRSKISLCVYYVFIHIFALTLDVSKVYGGVRLNRFILL